MKKSTLETFIDKYSLNGLVNSVKFTVDSKNKQLKTSIYTDEKNVIGTIVMKNFTDITEDIDIGIFDTQKLVKMIGVLGEDITLLMNKNDKGMVTSLSISDKETTVQFVTADLSVISSIPNLKKLPTFNVEIELDDSFVTKFAKAKNSLPDEEIFTLMNNKKGELLTMIGYSTINSNRITLSTKTVDGKNKLVKEISFSAKYFKEILSANSDTLTGAIYKVSDAGLSMVSFNSSEFDSIYYILETKRQ